MKIGIDISQMVYAGTGVGRYTRGLLDGILKYETRHEWIFFFASLRRNLPEEWRQAIRKRGFKIRAYKIPPTLLSLAWNRWHALKVEWLTGSLDWFITSDWTEPPAGKTKKATIIHDLVYLRYPETVDWKILKTQQERLTHVCRESDLVFADSNATKNDIHELLNLSKAKVKVIYPGVEIKVPPAETDQSVLRRYRLKAKEFILTVGKLEPRKNLERLIMAHQTLGQEVQLPLVIVGPKGWGSLQLVGRNVKTIGFVRDEELYSLYRQCRLFVYPSLYEGFGYPLVEAALMGAPMAVSNTSSLKELGQGVAELFNPLDVGDMAIKMERLLKDNDRLKELSDKGKVKSLEFSWQSTVEKMVKSFETHR